MIYSDFEIETEQCPACGKIFKVIARNLHPGILNGGDLTCPKCGMVLWEGAGYLWLYPEIQDKNIKPETAVMTETCPLCGEKVNYTQGAKLKPLDLDILYCPKCDAMLAASTKYRFKIC